MQSDRNYRLLVTLAVIGLVIGSWGVMNALWWGKRATALGSYVPWGLWVAVYLLFLGLTAGAFLITILTYVFRVKIFAPVYALPAGHKLVEVLSDPKKLPLFIVSDLVIGETSPFPSLLPPRAQKKRQSHPRPCLCLRSPDALPAELPPPAPRRRPGRLLLPRS